MITQRLSLYLILSICLSTSVLAQNNRLNTYETIGWYNYFGTFKITEKVSFHTEYQWRRDDVITNRQQSLLRLGFNYHVKPDLLLRAGYAWIETYSYGDIPINALGRNFTEHRIFQMAQLSHRQGITEITHRFMSEQRFVGRYSSPAIEKKMSFHYCTGLDIC